MSAEIAPEDYVEYWLAMDRVARLIEREILGFCKVVCLGNQIDAAGLCHSLILRNDSIDLRHLNVAIVCSRLTELHWEIEEEKRDTGRRMIELAQVAPSENGGPEWERNREIVSAYLVGDQTQRDLASRHGITERQIRRILRDPRWSPIFAVDGRFRKHSPSRNEMHSQGLRRNPPERRATSRDTRERAFKAFELSKTMPQREVALSLGCSAPYVRRLVSLYKTGRIFE